MRLNTRLLLGAPICALLYSISGDPGKISANQGRKVALALTKETLVYVGTKNRGIHVFRLQTRELEVSQNITLVPLGLAAETPDSSYLELDARRRLLFAVNQQDAGTVSAFSVEPDSGKLTLLNQRPTKGSRPCYLTLDQERKNLLVAHCGSASVAVLPVASDGRLGETAVAAFSGQAAACVTLDPAGRFAFVCDPASDRIIVYRFDARNGNLTPNEPGAVAIKRGSHPRRMLFRPDGKFAYVLNEATSTVISFAYNAETGSLKELEEASTLPGYFDGKNAAGELGMHPSGKWLYASNLGHNSVVLFDIHPEKGTLNYVEEQGTGGSHPVHFGIQPSAEHLAITNRDTNQVLASRIDSGNGRLKPSGIFASAPWPVCARFLPPQ